MQGHNAVWKASRGGFSSIEQLLLASCVDTSPTVTTVTPWLWHICMCHIKTGCMHSCSSCSQRQKQHANYSDSCSSCHACLDTSKVKEAHLSNSQCRLCHMKMAIAMPARHLPRQVSCHSLVLEATSILPPSFANRCWGKQKPNLCGECKLQGVMHPM